MYAVLLFDFWALVFWKPCCSFSFRASIIVAWGSAGAAAGVAVPGNTARMNPAYPPESVIDTLGAGDTFNAGFIHAMKRSNDTHTSVDYACRLAGTKVGSFGYQCLRHFPREVNLKETLWRFYFYIKKSGNNLFWTSFAWCTVEERSELFHSTKY